MGRGWPYPQYQQLSDLGVSMKARRLNGKVVVLAVVGVALAVGLGRLAVPHWRSPSAAATTGPGTPAQPSPARTSRDSGLVEALGSKVVWLGEKKYPSTYAGAYITPSDRSVVIYTTTPDDLTFKRAVAKLNTGNEPVRILRSAFSYKQLEADTVRLAHQSKRLQNDGITPTVWGPDRPYDAVYVHVQRPSDQDLQRLSASGLVPASVTPVTRANYTAAANAAIASAVGPHYKVLPTYQPVVRG